MWQTDPAKKIGEARIGADGVESRVNIDVNNSPLSKFLLQSGECSILFFQHRVITSRTIVVAFSFAILGSLSEVPLVP